MGSGNGQLVDEGLTAIRMAFDGHQFVNDAAKQCAELMMAGAHRHLEIPDSAAMEMYGIVTQGSGGAITRTNSEGKGFRAVISSYEDLAELFAGKLEAEYIDQSGSVDEQ